MNYVSQVLIVDDQALMRNHMQRLLQGEGYDLHFASNGIEALDKIFNLKPDLVLLDVRMPGINGFDVCRKVRENPPTADIPIIMVTAFDDRAARLRGIEAGADDFIPKPYDTLELQARVRTITRLNRYRRLLDEKAKFQLVADLSENGYMLISPNGKCTFANHQARLYMGLQVDMDEPIKGSFLDVAKAKYLLESNTAWENWPEWPADGETRYLLRPETIEKPPLWLQVETLDKLVSDEEMVWMVSLKDITSQIMARQDMWKFQRAIHHKMRTPLIGMYSGIQFLAAYKDELSAEEVQDLLDTALKHGERLKEAIENVLQYVNSPNIRQPGETFALQELPALVNELGATLEINTIKVTIVDSHEAGPTDLSLSKKSLEVILGELFDNSCKFHPTKDPAINIEASLIEQENRIKLTVTDNGLNISPEELKYICQPYYQSESRFTGEVKGIGLGLATVASVLWSIGGTFDINNRPDGQAGLQAIMLIPLTPSLVYFETLDS
ncbi:MAG: two-component system cell cycle response regulator [Candidatus Promineifilaceae bacterium]|jgi:two-component system cell cycle response regulator